GLGSRPHVSRARLLPSRASGVKVLRRLCRLGAFFVGRAVALRAVTGGAHLLLQQRRRDRERLARLLGQLRVVADLAERAQDLVLEARVLALQLLDPPALLGQPALALGHVRTRLLQRTLEIGHLLARRRELAFEKSDLAARLRQLLVALPE